MAKAEYRSAIRSRKLIHGALADLLQEKPLDKITVTDVVRKAEINRGTFYGHYTDIPDVIHHIIEETFSHIRDQVFEQPQNLEDIPHMLLQGIREVLEADMEFWRKVMNSGASSLMEEELVKLFLEYLLCHEEKFGFGNQEQYALTLRFCAGGLGNLYKDWLSGEISLSLEELTQEAEDLLNKIIGLPRRRAGK